MAGFKTLAPLLALTAAWAVQAAPEAEVKMRDESFANWHVLGETVKFKAESPLPEGAVSLSGKVFDSSGAQVASSNVDVKAFASSGWTWKPAAPGFYKIRFSVGDASGAETSLVDKVPFKLRNSTFALLGEKSISYQDHSVAVLPSPTRSPQEIPSQAGAGVSLAWANGVQALDEEFAQRKKDGLPLGSGPNMQAVAKASEEQLKEARLVGFNFLRFHAALWGRVAVSETDRNWELTDFMMNRAHEAGFEVIPNVYGSPKWAVDKPAEDIRFGLRYFGQPPKDLRHWTSFLKEMVERYPWVKEWELWNEPGFNSAFWYGSLDEYCELQKSGFETVKALRPDSVVWLSHPFPDVYKQLLKKGCAKYFDKLDVHGHCVDNSVNKKLEAMNGVSKPWGCLEWHGVVVSAGDVPAPAPFPSESALARRMVLDFVNQLRLGAEKIAFFTISSDVRMEMLEFAREKGETFTHSAGMFNNVPCVQPRLAALVYRNFIDCFSGDIAYGDGFLFGESQRAVLLRSSAGDVLLLWQAGKEPCQVDPELAKAFATSSELIDWEGRKLAASPMLKLQPETVYFLKRPDAAAVSKWACKGVVTQSVVNAPVLDASIRGRFRDGALFDKDMNLIDPGSLVWNDAGEYVSLDGRPAAKGFAARFAVGLDERGLDLLVDVSDATHSQPFDGAKLWGGDSVQFGVDSQGKGLLDDRFEFIAALTSNGPLLWKDSVPVFDGYLMPRYTPAGRPVEFAALKIEKTSGGLLCKIHVDKDELHPLSFSPAKPLRFSLLVNDNNGSGRAGYLEWGSGIGKGKDPSAYGTLTRDIGSGEILSLRDFSKELKPEYDACSFKAIDVGADAPFVRVVSSAGKGRKGVVSTRFAKLAPGAEYVLSFKARGDVSLEACCFASDAKGASRRIDLGRLAPSSSWTEFKGLFVAPEDCAGGSFAVFCWEQSGSFDIKDFKLTSGSF